MREFNTKYGILKGISSFELYECGNIKECILEEANELDTPYGLLMPQYEQDHVRRKYTSSVSFYENGNIRSIALNYQITITTEIGRFEAEKITFYEDEKIKRIFPVNGKLTGYWTEENEYDFAKEYTVQLSCGIVRGKFISVQFYPSQKLKSITLWPKERVILDTPFGKMRIRTGIALYETGILKSCEPAAPVPVTTPIGVIMAYDTRTLGIHGEKNSLQFYEDGTIRALVTSTDKVAIFDENNEFDDHITVYAPEEVPNPFNPDITDIIPLRIAFYNGKVSMNEELEYEEERYSFSITNHFKRTTSGCGNCSNCNLCG